MNEPIDPPATHLSRTAVLAAMFAIPLCCPPMSALACITGAVALWQIRRDPALHGRWLAWIAIAVGAACAIIMSWLLWANGLAVIVRGPLPPMQALMSGSPERVRAEWTGPATELDEAALRTFAEALRSRHGELRDAIPSRSRTLPIKPKPRQAIATVPVTLVFERGPVEADLGLELFDERAGGTVMRWRSIRITEPDGGDLVFPPGEPAPPPLDAGTPASAGAPPAADQPKPSRQPASPLP